MHLKIGTLKSEVYIQLGFINQIPYRKLCVKIVQKVSFWLQIRYARTMLENGGKLVKSHLGIIIVSVYPQFRLAVRTSFEYQKNLWRVLRMRRWWFLEPFYIIIVQLSWAALRLSNNTLWCLHHLLVEKWWWWFAQGDAKTSYHSRIFTLRCKGLTIFIDSKNHTIKTTFGFDTS